MPVSDKPSVSGYNWKRKLLMRLVENVTIRLKVVFGKVTAQNWTVRRIFAWARLSLSKAKCPVGRISCSSGLVPTNDNMATSMAEGTGWQCV